jgi:hypothetical protein
MLSKCANPDCTSTLHYLREGKVFKVESEAGIFLLDGTKPARKVEHFWLCGNCSSTMTLTYDKVRGVQMTKKSLHRRAAAS